MNRNEAGAVLALMTAAWPNQKITEQTARVWIDMLERVDPEDGVAAARLLIANEEWFPPVTKFIETAQGLARRRASTRTALPSGEKRVPCPPELMERMRTVLKKAP